MYLGIDLGGTNIAVGAVKEDGTILCTVSAPTGRERGGAEIVRDTARLCREAVRQAGGSVQDIRAAGIGCPGTVDSARGTTVYLCNMNMDHFPLAAELESSLHVPVFLENDANAAAYGEYAVYGDGAASLILLTLGTGVGGGIVLGGEIYRGFNGAGGEIGHMTLVHGGKQCACGRRGCLEQYASATALIEQTKEKLLQCPESAMHEWVRRHGGADGRTAFECAAAGDGAAQEVLDRYISYVADGAASVINIFQPELLVIGGGVSNAGDALIAPLREKAEAMDYNRSLTRTAIRAAKLRNDAGIVGAAMAAKHAVNRQTAEA